MGGVGGGVAAEGPVILSDLLIPSTFHNTSTGGRSKWTQGQYTEQKCASAADKGHHLYANALWGFQREQKQKDEVCRSFGGEWGCKTEARRPKH